MSRRRPQPLVLVASVGIAVACAHGVPVPVGPCSEVGETLPKVSSFCGDPAAANKYVGRLRNAIVRSLRKRDEVISGLVMVSFAEGPRVSSVCYGKFTPALSESELQRLAIAAAETSVPTRLACFAGHRLEHPVTANPVDSHAPALPSGGGSSY